MLFVFFITKSCPLVFQTLFLRSVTSKRIWLISVLDNLAEDTPEIYSLAFLYYYCKKVELYTDYLERKGVVSENILITDKLEYFWNSLWWKWPCSIVPFFSLVLWYNLFFFFLEYSWFTKLYFRYTADRFSVLHTHTHIHTYIDTYKYSCLFSHLSPCDPCTVARQAPLSMGFPRQGYRSGLPFPSNSKAWIIFLFI